MMPLLLLWSADLVIKTNKNDSLTHRMADMISEKDILLTLPGRYLVSEEHDASDFRPRTTPNGNVH